MKRKCVFINSRAYVDNGAWEIWWSMSAGNIRISNTGQELVFLEEKSRWEEVTLLVI